MENHISVVVPCFNENITKIQHAVDHFTSSKLVSDVIIVDDNSTIPVKVKNAKVIRNTICLGRAASISIGISSANSKIILTTDLDSKFKTKEWSKYIIEAVLSNPKSIICPSYIPVGQCSLKKKIYGGYLDCITSRGGKSIVLESRWRTEIPSKKLIDCIKGSTYAFDSKFVKLINGFSGVKGWCATETIALSLKSRLVGGNCMILPNVEIECNFMPQLNSSPIVYNKMRLAFVTMPPEVYTIIPALLNTPSGIQSSINSFMSDYKQIIEEREKFIEIRKIDAWESFKLAGIDLGIKVRKKHE